jgi:hypothetical protein
MTETDPNGLDPHEPGAKLDAGKIRPQLVLGGFSRALEEVVKVGTYGANKYTELSDIQMLQCVTGWKRRKDSSATRKATCCTPHTSPGMPWHDWS